MLNTEARLSSALLSFQPLRACVKRKPTRLHTCIRSYNAALDVQLQLAASSDLLDLSESDLQEVPTEIFDLQNLTELSLAGNALSHLPAEISKLTRLQKLQLAGNALRELPEEIGALTDLQGFWVHGNFLEKLPESFGNLAGLQKCSLSGNRLQTLPSTLSLATGLIELEAAGNQLKRLPTLEGLQHLQKLTLHGNDLAELPDSILSCLCLQSLALQGNAIDKISSSGCFFPQGLKSLNIADNQLRCLACDISNLIELEDLTLYGNQLNTLPAGLFDLPKLKAVWLEGNPLDAATLREVIVKKTVKVGLDLKQWASSGQSQSNNTLVSFSQVPTPYQKGYFKLIRDQQDQASDMVVIAFGSAPGTPNWGSVLRKVKERSHTKPSTKRHSFEQSRILDDQKRTDVKFDVLFVVDPSRSWYGAGDAEFERYTTVLQDICAAYPHRVMIGRVIYQRDDGRLVTFLSLGDSMGASAALLFSDLATYVLAFCPQIDLSSASIRPAYSPQQWSALKQQIESKVEQTSANINVISLINPHAIHRRVP